MAKEPLEIFDLAAEIYMMRAHAISQAIAMDVLGSHMLSDERDTTRSIGPFHAHMLSKLLATPLTTI